MDPVPLETWSIACIFTNRKFRNTCVCSATRDSSILGSTHNAGSMRCVLRRFSSWTSGLRSTASSGSKTSSVSMPCSPTKKPNAPNDKGDHSMNTGTLQVKANADREIVMTRLFDAPRSLVFDAFTKPELLKRWLLGPPGWSMPVCEIDLRVGGSYRYVWRRGPTRAETGR